MPLYIEEGGHLSRCHLFITDRLWKIVLLSSWVVLYEWSPRSANTHWWQNQLQKQLFIFSLNVWLHRAHIQWESLLNVTAWSRTSLGCWKSSEAFVNVKYNHTKIITITHTRAVWDTLPRCDGAESHSVRMAATQMAPVTPKHLWEKWKHVEVQIQQDHLRWLQHCCSTTVP